MRIVDNQPLRDIGQSISARGGGQSEADLRIDQHVIDPLVRIVGIDRHERSACLGDGKYRHHGRERTWDTDRYIVLGSQAVRDEHASNAIGEDVQLAVGHAAVRRFHGRCVRITLGCLVEDLREDARRPAGRATDWHQFSMFGGCEHRHHSQGTIRLGTRFEYAPQSSGDLFDVGGTENLGYVLEFQAEPGVDRCYEAERVVGSVLGFDIGDPDPRNIGIGRKPLTVNGIRFEDSQRVESDLRPRAYVDLGKPETVVIRQLCLLGLDPREECADTFTRAQRDSDRNCVDEQPDHGFDPGQLGRSTRHRRSEHHIVSPGQCSKDDPPRCLNNRVDRQPEFTRHSAK